MSGSHAKADRDRAPAHTAPERRDAAARAGDADLARRLDEFTDVMRRLAAGDFAARAERGDVGTPCDVLAFMINAVAEELGDSFHRATLRERYLKTVFAAIADPLLVVRPTGTVESANAALAAVLDRPLEQIIGRPWQELVPADAETAWFADVLKGHVVRNRDTRFVGDRGTVELVVNAAPVRDGEVLHGVVVVARDLRTERELARLVESRL